MDKQLILYVVQSAWNNAAELSCFGDGQNIIPTIHVNDLAAYVALPLLQSVAVIQFRFCTSPFGLVQQTLVFTSCSEPPLLDFSSLPGFGLGLYFVFVCSLRFNIFCLLALA